MDALLVLHIVIQGITFALILPTGMVLGLARSKWHAKVQSTGVALSVLGSLLGLFHGGRRYAPSAHGMLGTLLMLLISMQAATGIVMKSSPPRPAKAALRSRILLLHKIVGVLVVPASWAQIVLGGITALEFCGGWWLSQCVVHSIEGTAFLAHGVAWTIVLRVGQPWLRGTGRSVDFFDSLHLLFWGVVNTFTEHRWGMAWQTRDIQHTSFGVLYWTAAMLGVWQTWKRSPTPARSLVPSLLFILSGWLFAGHEQSLHLSTKIHEAAGYTMMALGFSRMLEVVFLNTKDPSLSAFHHVPIFCMYSSSFFFLMATDEQLKMFAKWKISHLAYLSIIYSLAFLWFLFIELLIHLYKILAPRLDKDARPARGERYIDRDAGSEEDLELEDLLQQDELTVKA